MRKRCSSAYYSAGFRKLLTDDEPACAGFPSVWSAVSSLSRIGKAPRSGRSSPGGQRRRRRENSPAAFGTEALQFFPHPGEPGMRTARRESQPAFLITWRGAVRERAVRPRCEPSAPATRTVTFFTNLKHELRTLPPPRPLCVPSAAAPVASRLLPLRRKKNEPIRERRMFWMVPTGQRSILSGHDSSRCLSCFRHV